MRDAAIDRHLPVVGLLLAGDEAEDGRLAGAVRADQADLLAAMNGRRRLDEEDLRPCCLLIWSRRIMKRPD
jgi:hypothetical protein